MSFVLVRQNGNNTADDNNSKTGFLDPGSIYKNLPNHIQAKLMISQPGDAYEEEADRIADNVVNMTGPIAPQNTSGEQLSRKCSMCDDEETEIHRKASNNLDLSDKAFQDINKIQNNGGKSLDDSTQAFMESRFGFDFSKVRIHTDAQAARSAHAINAHAYTMGNHIMFGDTKFSPETHEGRRLIAHELVHVVQQNASSTIHAKDKKGTKTHDGFLLNTAGQSPQITQIENNQMLSRFSDTGHHVVEEAALHGAGFNEDQIKGIERGNVQRDYSQVGMLGNLALLCKPRKFGGYQPKEHFDNYIWDAVTQGWRTRGGSAFSEKGVDAGQTPIDYISSELESVASLGITAGKDRGLVHLGNAFHTVEDFFAHSNFVELIQGDTSQGRTLMTGNPIGPSQSVSRILESITPSGVKEYYTGESEHAIRTAAPGTHTKMAHDDPTTPNYTLARRLAALVIQDLGAEVLAVMASPEPQRSALMHDRVIKKIIRYLRPPDVHDKWWETLTTADAGKIDTLLEEASRRTPTTVNQCALSPLKNLEASRDSPMALPIGVAMPTTIMGNQVWFHAGAGVTRPVPFEPTSKPRPVIGIEITGTF